MKGFSSKWKLSSENGATQRGRNSPQEGGRGDEEISAQRMTLFGV